jgi:hypothetical protein
LVKVNIGHDSDRRAADRSRYDGLGLLRLHHFGLSDPAASFCGDKSAKQVLLRCTFQSSKNVILTEFRSLAR